MAKNIEDQVAIRIWAWLSRDVNHPNIARPSHWLVGELLRKLPEDRVSDAIWKIARKALSLNFPGLDRPLGSCLHPGVDNVLDVSYWYGQATQKVLRKVASAAAEIAHAGDGLWEVEETSSGTVYIPPTARPRGAHIGVCPELLRELANAIRSGSAPDANQVGIRWFRPTWDQDRAGAAQRDAEARKRLEGLTTLLETHKVSVVMGRDPRVEGAERYYDSAHCPNGRHTNRWCTDGQKSEGATTVLEQPQGYFTGGGETAVTIEGATYAFSREFTPGRGGGISVRSLTLWPGFRPNLVAEALGAALNR